MSSMGLPEEIWPQNSFLAKRHRPAPNSACIRASSAVGGNTFIIIIIFIFYYLSESYFVSFCSFARVLSYCFMDCFVRFPFYLKNWSQKHPS